MTFLVDNWFLILAALISGGLLLWPLVSGGSLAGGLKPADAVQLINREKAVVIDVCGTGEFAAGHVVGSRNIPLDQLESLLPGAVKNKALPVILVCASGMRSSRAVAIAKKLGYEKAASLEGGMKAWRAANLPVEKS
ncbi:rhodanese-like domain-containing protein [Malikia sp.]|uniref:rhodanese-like domain-containing protein n=1 Tax=Malikia sp. TaxID=2070706 RepID=UPI00262A8D23|nr:rhodanese-like domain-containing protein [Malikia sp.]MDD2729151.1 rhodanese-like domain-containing protein [Malikia sp.]